MAAATLSTWPGVKINDNKLLERKRCNRSGIGFLAGCPAADTGNSTLLGNRNESDLSDSLRLEEWNFRKMHSWKEIRRLENQSKLNARSLFKGAVNFGLI